MYVATGMHDAHDERCSSAVLRYQDTRQGHNARMEAAAIPKAAAVLAHCFSASLLAMGNVSASFPTSTVEGCFSNVHALAPAKRMADPARSQDAVACIAILPLRSTSRSGTAINEEVKRKTSTNTE